MVPQTLRLGINGYYLDQFTDDKVNGHNIPNSQEKVFGIGPGLVYHMGKEAHLFFNVYEEMGVENRTQGTVFNLRFVKHF